MKLFGLNISRSSSASVTKSASESDAAAWLRGEDDGFDFPPEHILGLFGELCAKAGGIDAGAAELRQCQQAKEVGFDF